MLAAAVFEVLQTSCEDRSAAMPCQPVRSLPLNRAVKPPAAVVLLGLRKTPAGSRRIERQADAQAKLLERGTPTISATMESPGAKRAMAGRRIETHVRVTNRE